MAVKWAIVNGNWNTGSTWNDGAIPISADEVYLNGYTVTVNTGNTLNANSISNGENSDYGIVEGGLLYFNRYNGCTINANLIQKGLNVLCDGTFTNTSLWIVINGNITNENAYVIQYDGLLNLNISIFGNIEIGAMPIFRTNNSLNLQFSLNITSSNYFKNPNNTALFGHLQAAFTMTSCTLTGLYFENFNKGNGALTTLTVNVTDYLSLSTNLGITTANFNGKLKCNSNVLMTGTTLNINGGIEYINTQNNVGVRFTTININNRNSFIWRDITEPKLNPFMIITEADLNNEVQYPNENRVVAGTPYAFDEKVGTFTVDYPPETVVLKDYVYDGGEMVGTLDLPQAPTTSDIVIAIKNDSDLGGKIDTTNTNVSNISTTVTTIDGKVDIIDTNVDTLLSRLTSVLTQRLGQSVTVEILQQIFVAHLDN